MRFIKAGNDLLPITELTALASSRCVKLSEVEIISQQYRHRIYTLGLQLVRELYKVS